jgi:hypothetical protein
MTSGQIELDVHVRPARGVRIVSVEPEKVILIIPEVKKLKVKANPNKE